MALEGLSPTLWTILIIVMIWSGVWKAIALWKSARHKQLVWFIVLIVFHTASILELIYLGFFQRKR